MKTALNMQPEKMAQKNYACVRNLVLGFSPDAGLPAAKGSYDGE
jgi:hypothetical protein